MLVHCACNMLGSDGAEMNHCKLKIRGGEAKVSVYQSKVQLWNILKKEIMCIF